eukprot:6209061-Pleurochrysis_carterae.AAC.4
MIHTFFSALDARGYLGFSMVLFTDLFSAIPPPPLLGRPPFPGVSPPCSHSPTAAFGAASLPRCADADARPPAPARRRVPPHLGLPQAEPRPLHRAGKSAPNQGGKRAA